MTTEIENAEQLVEERLHQLAGFARVEPDPDRIPSMASATTGSAPARGWLVAASFIVVACVALGAVATGRLEAKQRQVDTVGPAATTPTTVPSVLSPSPTQPTTNAPPFDAPAGYPTQPPEVMAGATSGRVVTFTFAKPSDPLNKVIGATVAVSLLDARSISPATSTPAGFANAVTGSQKYIDVEVGGRLVARQAEDDVLSGASLGLPDRHATMYIFRSGGLAVEIMAQDAPTEDVVGIVRSFDDARAQQTYDAA